MKFIPFTFAAGKPKQSEESKDKVNSTEKIDSKKVIKLTPEAIQKNYIIADCCKPIPGDDVLGFINDKNQSCRMGNWKGS